MYQSNQRPIAQAHQDPCLVAEMKNFWSSLWEHKDALELGNRALEIVLHQSELPLHLPKRQCNLLLLLLK